VRLSFALLVILDLVGCGAARPNDPDQPGPQLVFPAHFAEGDNEEEARRREAKQPAEKPAEPPKGSQPDPEPLRQKEQYEYELAYVRGEVSVTKVRPVTYEQPVVTARRIGRFAIELWIGQELVDRVRFDFPMTAADEPVAQGRERLSAAPNLGEGASVTHLVLVPAAPRARRALLVDRATNAVIELPWPPDRVPIAPAEKPEAPLERP
jgi:hypothetical protein